jgi:hypothetical protein
VDAVDANWLSERLKPTVTLPKSARFVFSRKMAESVAVVEVALGVPSSTLPVNPEPPTANS